MDEYATPVDQIRSDMQQEPMQQNANYADLLQTMEQHQQGPVRSEHNTMDYPPPPIVQSNTRAAVVVTTPAVAIDA